MRIVGEWYVCADGVTRPTMMASLTDSAGHPLRDRFLIDSGADRTVLTANLVSRLGLPTQPSPGWSLSGVGGTQAFVQVSTTLTLTADDNSPARFVALFAAFTVSGSDDLNILGRDILDHFHVILSRPLGEVLLLATNHCYVVNRI